jgi:hypothetical protein
LPSFVQSRLNLSADQREKLTRLQGDVDQKLGKILTAEQKKQLAEMRQGMGRGGPGFGGPGFGRGGRRGGEGSPGGPPDGPPPGDFAGGRGFPGGPGGPGGPPAPGQILPVPLQDELRLDDGQKKQLNALQSEVDGELSSILTEDQKKQLHDGIRGFGPPGRGRNGRGPGGLGGPPDGDGPPPGSPGGFGGPPGR